MRKAIEIVRSDGLIPLLSKVPHHFHWRIVKALEPAVKWRFEKKYGSGLDVMNEDWDNLILLDACRYDYFKKYTSFEGDLSRVVSKGRGSHEFMRKNYVGKELHDTVYVTANPHAEHIEQDVFFTIETVLDKWDPKMGTVPPGCVTEAAIEAQEKYPDKRLIIHYMQPHTPHLGEIAQDLETKYTLNETANPAGDTEVEEKKIFEYYRDNQITTAELRESYRETLSIVELHVKDLIEELYGKTVISSDHGENLGETQFGMRLTGHGPNSKEVRFVPWLELPYEERKTTKKEPPIGFQYLEDKYVEDRLADLGYM
jgi:hypothetical protein